MRKLGFVRKASVFTHEAKFTSVADFHRRLLPAKSSHSTLQLHDVAVTEKKRKMLIVTRN